jgi:IS5 family transposase
LKTLVISNKGDEEMRLIKKLQLFLCPAKVCSDQSQELREIDSILSELPGMKEFYTELLQEINHGRDNKTGRDGLSAEQVVKLGLLRKRSGLSYRDLAHATQDSMSMRAFLNLPLGEGISKSAIQSNLKAVSEGRWEKLHKKIADYARTKEIESGEALRGDCTTVETNIHYPTDANLLNATVRVLCRHMHRATKIVGDYAQYEDRSRRAKSKLFKINNIRGESKQHPHYLELIRITRETIQYAEKMLPLLASYECSDLMQGLRLDAIQAELKTYILRGEKVVNQAYRRIVKKEEVPVAEKIVSIFEVHTDIIVKGFRDVVFGHKVFLTTGASGLILDLQVLDGNPKDSTLVPQTLERHIGNTGAAPEALAFDGCFASTANRDFAKKLGVKDLTFSKNRRMSLDSLMSSPKLHKALKNFRAGVEGCISFLKRVFGFSRVLDKSLETFKAALHSAAAAYNLTLLARIRLAAASTATS